ncbi:Carcinoembryonic antigen-related cell adhesion molecule 18 [Apodemus speciosus]|uniref:Carcinoembryonic antigen-related cell adhesion molecule 18 n=1 Tax=Apodemus speciosus TaxID=105296 RepID=A0ABQ0EY68_APOSI
MNKAFHNRSYCNRQQATHTRGSTWAHSLKPTKMLVHSYRTHGRLPRQPSANPGYPEVTSGPPSSKVEAWPEAKCHWMYNGSLLSISEENVTLPSLSCKQMGSYRCIVQNLETQLAFYRDVTIQPPPR